MIQLVEATLIAVATPFCARLRVPVVVLFARVKVSVVIPVFNEAGLLEELCERLTRVMEQCEPHYELVFVDDGSTDGSYERLKKLRETDERVKVIRFTRNFGQQAAVLAGFRNSAGPVMVQIDSDLQNPPEEIPKLLAAMTDDVDLVTTVVKKRKDGLLRVVGSRLLMRLGRLISGNRFQLNLSSFRALRRSVLEKIETCTDRSRYLAVLMSWMAVPTVEIEVEHHQRPSGDTKYPFFNLVRLAWDMVTGYSNMPLRLVTYLGIAGSCLGFLLTAFLLYQRFVNGILVDGLVVMCAVFAFFAGVQLFSIGILGEYLGRVYLQVQNRPDYIVEKVLD